MRTVLLPENFIRKLVPIGIDGFYQPIFLFPFPTLYLLFSCNRGSYIVKRFKINQFVNVVSFGKSFDQSILVFKHATLQIIGYADIQHFIGFVRQNVDVIHALVAAAAGGAVVGAARLLLSCDLCIDGAVDATHQFVYLILRCLQLHVSGTGNDGVIDLLHAGV